MSKIVNEVLAANASYVSGFGTKGMLAMPPARRFAILTSWTPGSTLRNTPASPRVMRMSFATPVDARPTMRSAAALMPSAGT